MEPLTEAEWLSTPDWLPLWWSWPDDLRSERKVRLFAAAACRRVAHRMDDPRTLHALQASEQFADGGATADELAAAYEATGSVSGSVFPPTMPAISWAVAAAARWLCHPDVFKVGRAAEEVPSVDGYEAVITAGLLDPATPPDIHAISRHAGNRNGVVTPSDWGLIWQHEVFRRGEAAGRRVQADLLRAVVGNPFRPVSFGPSWQTSTAVALARQMYESRDFSPMPILADALQDAGCDNPDILDHCRGPGPHVRGCRVVDLVLGKS
ncbi:MAG: hypothetical protein JWO38_1128 [Gemmataceae bacterium]|nr:hypothetical protein [Gemmataceae bacterium]